MKLIRRNEYVAVPVRLLRDTELSIRGKGVLSVLAAMPEATALTEYDLRSACRMPMEDVSEVVHELERAGYFVREGGALYVFDAPQNGREL